MLGLDCLGPRANLPPSRGSHRCFYNRRVPNHDERPVGVNAKHFSILHIRVHLHWAYDDGHDGKRKPGLCPNLLDN